MMDSRRPWSYQQPWGWRWRGTERWHRWCIGPLAFSFYAGSSPRRWYWAGFSWRYQDAGGTWRHASSLRAWRKKRRRASEQRDR